VALPQHRYCTNCRFHHLRPLASVPSGGLKPGFELSDAEHICLALHDPVTGKQRANIYCKEARTFGAPCGPLADLYSPTERV